MDLEPSCFDSKELHSRSSSKARRRLSNCRQLSTMSTLCSKVCNLFTKFSRALKCWPDDEISSPREGVQESRTAQSVDHIPFLLLLKNLPPFIVSVILSHTPHLLTVEELLLAGCPLKLLVREGRFSKVETLCVFRRFYRRLNTCAPLEKENMILVRPGLSPFPRYETHLRQPTAPITLPSRWGIIARKRVSEQADLDRIIRCLIVSGDRGLVATGDTEGGIRIWDAESRECIVSIEKVHSGYVQHLAFHYDQACSSNGPSSIISAGVYGDNDVKVWNIATGECEAVLKGHTSYITDIISLQDGSIASSSQDGSIMIWQLLTPPQQGPLSNGHHLVRVPSSVHLSSESETNNLSSTNLPAPPAGFSAHHDPASMTGRSSTALVTSPLNEGVPARIAVPGRARRGGRCLIKILICMLSHPTSLLQLPNGHLVTGCSDGSIRILHVTNTSCGKRNASYVRMLRGHVGPVRCFALLGDDVTLISAGCDASIKIWDTTEPDPQLALVKTLNGHGWEVSSLTVGSDGVTFLSEDRAGAMSTWTC